MRNALEQEVLWPFTLLERAMVTPNARPEDPYFFVSCRDGDRWRRVARFDSGPVATVFTTLLVGAGYEARCVCGGPKR